MQDVRHVPRCYLDRYTITLEGGSWKITKGNLTIAQGNKVGTLYMSEKGMKLFIVVLILSCGTKHSSTWVKLLTSKVKLPNLKSVDVDLCQDRVYSKWKNGYLLIDKKHIKGWKLESLNWCIQIYEGQPQWNLSMASAIMSPSLMIQLERFGFIFPKINLFCLLHLKGRKPK